MIFTGNPFRSNGLGVAAAAAALCLPSVLVLRL